MKLPHTNLISEGLPVFDLHSNTSINAFDSSLSFCPESDQTSGSILYAQNKYCDKENRVYKYNVRDCSDLNDKRLFYAYETTINPEDWRQMDREDISNLALPGDEPHLKDGLWNG